jgi:NAD(P)-dependent dehydrogenase (short-subunit alcohol dehydrogenase family)
MESIRVAHRHVVKAIADKGIRGAAATSVRSNENACPPMTIPPTIVDTPIARKAEASGAFPFGSIDNLVGMVPLGRLGTPDDIAATAAFLCSDEGGYITGQVIGVNGGMRI